jgi:two-component system phosphate regulon response regulator PhoB
MKNLLLVEDDLSLGESLSERLSKDFNTVWVQTAQGAIKAAQSQEFDIAVLDIGLPDGSGMEVAKYLRINSNAAFVFLTAQADAETRLMGFEIGADEFIPKPFHLKELLLRLKHVQENHFKTMKMDLIHSKIDFDQMTITKADGTVTRLTLTENKVLKLLTKNMNKVFSRDEIMDFVWGAGAELSHRTIDNIVLKIRSGLSEAEAAMIKSVRGVGYQFVSQNSEGNEK